MKAELRLGIVTAMLAGIAVGCGSGAAATDAGDAAMGASDAAVEASDAADEASTDTRADKADASWDDATPADATHDQLDAYGADATDGGDAMPADAAHGQVDADGAETIDGGPTDAAGPEVQCWNVYRTPGCGASAPAPNCVALTGACTIPACSCEGRVILGCNEYAQPYAYKFCSGGASCPNPSEVLGNPCDPGGCDGGQCPFPSLLDGSIEHIIDTDARDAVADHSPTDGTAANDASAPSDAADAADATPPRWTPASLTGVVLWLEADWGIETAPGEVVSFWRDRSAHNNHALQPDTAAAPTLAPAAVGSLPAVRFADPSWMIIVDRLSMRWGQDDFVLLVVERRAATCTHCESQLMFFHKSEAAAPWTGPQLYLMSPERKVRAYLTAGQDAWSTVGGYDDAKAHVFGVRRIASAIHLRADGLFAGSLPVATAANVDAPGRNAYIGAHGVAGNVYQFEGDIAAMVAVRGSLADADLARLEEYLLIKYGIAGAGPPAE